MLASAAIAPNRLAAGLGTRRARVNSTRDVKRATSMGGFGVSRDTSTPPSQARAADRCMLNNTCPDSDGHTAQSLALTRWTRGDLFFEGVLDLFAGVFEVGLRLVALALIFSALVAGDLADRFLSLAAEVLGLVLRLIRTAHSAAPTSRESPRWPNLSPLGTSPAGFQNVKVPLSQAVRILWVSARRRCPRLGDHAWMREAVGQWDEVRGKWKAQDTPGSITTVASEARPKVRAFLLSCPARVGPRRAPHPLVATSFDLGTVVTTSIMNSPSRLRRSRSRAALNTPADSVRLTESGREALISPEA